MEKWLNGGESEFRFAEPQLHGLRDRRMTYNDSAHDRKMFFEWPSSMYIYG